MEQILLQYGLSGVVIIALAGTVLFLYRELKSERDKNESLQDKRLADAIEARNKISEPIAQLISLSERIYNALPDKKGR